MLVGETDDDAEAARFMAEAGRGCRERRAAVRA